MDIIKTLEGEIHIGGFCLEDPRSGRRQGWGTEAVDHKEQFVTRLPTPRMTAWCLLAHCGGDDLTVTLYH